MPQGTCEKSQLSILDSSLPTSALHVSVTYVRELGRVTVGRDKGGGDTRCLDGQGQEEMWPQCPQRS